MLNKYNKTIPVMFAVALLASTFSSQAYDFSYNYIQGSYASSTDDSLGVDIDANTIGLFGSFEVSDYVAITAGFAGTDYDDINVDATELQIGATLHTSLGQMTDGFFNLSFIHVDIDSPLPFADGDDSGFGFVAGLRHAVNEVFELEAAFTHVDVFNDTTQIGFGARFYMSQAASIGIRYDTGDDVDTLSGNIRIQF